MAPPRNDPNQHPSDTRPFLCVPYWTTPLVAGGRWDDGDIRPLPPAVISYACESIHTSLYKAGTLLDVIVDVRNAGGGSVTPVVTVVVYWAVPSVGFGKPTFFAATAIAVAPTRTSAGLTPTAKMTAMIPATAPDHICLAVCVSHAQDRAGTVCDPIHDRHWAQRNLQAVSVALGAPTIFPMTVANPFPVATTFDLRVGPADERRAHVLARAFRTVPSGVRPRIRLLDEHGAAVAEGGEQILTTVQLGPLGETPFQLMLELDTELPQGQSTAVEASIQPHGTDQGAVGSLGIVLLPPGA